MGFEPIFFESQSNTLPIELWKPKIFILNKIFYTSLYNIKNNKKNSNPLKKNNFELNLVCKFFNT